MNGNKIKIKLKNVNEIKEFVRVVEKYKSDIDIITDRATVDAKSIIGILALDLSEDTYVRIITDDITEYRKFKAEMTDFR